MENKKSRNNKNACPICASAGKPPGMCPGHGKAGGSKGGGSGSSHSEAASKSATQSGKSQGAILANAAYTVDTIATLPQGITQTHAMNPFSPELIAAMLANQSLLIHNNTEACVLHIHASPATRLTHDQRIALDAYANAVLQVFNAFLKENKLNHNALPPGRDSEGYISSLKISLSPNLYPAFLAALNQHHLLPAEHMQKNNEQASHVLKQSPFAVRPEPNHSHSKSKPEETSQKWTPLKTKPTPKGIE